MFNEDLNAPFYLKEEKNENYAYVKRYAFLEEFF